MPKFKVFKGSLPEILAKEDLRRFHFIGQYDSYFQRINNVINDLLRIRFVVTDSHTVNEFIKLWLDKQTSNSYSQGNLQGEIFHDLLFSYLIKGITIKSKKDPVRSHLFSFCYIDANNTPCAISISYTDNNPSLWVATIIRNTNAEPGEREMTVIVNENVIENKDDLIDGSTAVKSFLDSFKSAPSVAKLFTGEATIEKGALRETTTDNKLAKVFTENGTLVIERLKELDNQLENCSLNENQNACLNNLLRTDQKAEDVKENTDNIEKIESIYKEKIDAAIEKYETTKKLQKEQIDSDLERTKKQSILRRNAVSFILATVSILSLIGVGLTLSGILAPLGLALIAGTALTTYLIPVAAAISGFVLGASALKIGKDEKKLTTYQQKLSDMAETQKASERATEKEILALENQRERAIKRLSTYGAGKEALAIQHEHNKALLHEWDVLSATGDENPALSSSSSASKSTEEPAVVQKSSVKTKATDVSSTLFSRKDNKQATVDPSTPPTPEA